MEKAAPENQAPGERRASRASLQVPSAELESIRELYQNGLCRQAYDRALRIGPPERWAGSEARILAGRILINLGAAQRGRVLHLTAWRSNRQDGEARAYLIAVMFEQFGPYAAWRRAQQFLAEPPPSLVTPVAKAARHYLFSLLGRIAASWRDFETAEVWLGRAEEVMPGHPWLHTERAFLLERQDRYEESLAAARRALEVRPWYRPGVQSTAHALQLLDRDAEALELLQAASQRVESVPLLTQLFGLQMDLRRHREAAETLERIPWLSPVLDEDHLAWLRSQRILVAYRAEDLPRAVELCQSSKEEREQDLGRRLANAGEPRPRSVRLPVEFVRQHEHTCAPATLSALSRFWKMPAAHLEVAEAICFDGTPAHSERRWATQNGYVAREFTVTWDAAVALLDRGVPFTLTTVDAASGHLQAVIGYDALRGTLLVRDPFIYFEGEADGPKLLEHYRAHGPRGMLLVPRAQAPVLDGLELPDAALYDQLHELQCRLEVHDRAAAQAVWQHLQAVAPGHRLTLTARRTLAAYDANMPALAACVDELLALFPGDNNLLLSKQNCLRELARREERISFLEQACADPKTDPVLWLHYGLELNDDARQREPAAWWLRRALRARPGDRACLSALADCRWSQRRFEEATELYRFAACLDDKQEQPARAYFTASRWLKRTEEALRLLRERFQRFGPRAALPGLTLFQALAQIDRMPEAFTVLDEALALKPEDGGLLLFAADAHARHGRFATADRLLAQAGGRAAETAIHRTTAQIARYRGDFTTALAHWRRVLEIEPTALDAHRSVTLHLAEVEGRPAALQHLQEACDRFPHNFLLHQLWADWSRDDGPAQAEPILRRLIAINPAEGWSRRELALNLAAQGRLEPALAEAGDAAQLDPLHPSSHAVLGDIQQRRGDAAAAKSAWQQAIRLEVDSTYAINGLLAGCATLSEKKDAITFLEQELLRQVVFGDGVLAFREVARAVLPAEELLSFLERALRERPDLWQTWSAQAEQLAAMGRLDEALERARQAAARFPLLPRVWLDLARVQQTALDSAGEIASLDQALQLSPGWSRAAHPLAAAHQRLGDIARALAVLEAASAHAPLDASLHGGVAEALWKLARKTEALERLQRALCLDPNYDWGWRMLRAWAQELDRPELAVELARDLTSRRGGEARPWLALAQMTYCREAPAEAIAAIERAIQLQPRFVDAHDMRAELLCFVGRHQDALDACAPAVFGDRVPVELQARAAWVEAARHELDRAITRMRAVLEENPGFVWGWRELADWLWRRGRLEESLDAATRLTQLDPNNPIPLGYRAELKLHRQDKDGAIADLTRAYQIDPSYAYAGTKLLDLQLEQNLLDAAEKTVATLRVQTGGGDALAAVVRLNCRRIQWLVEQPGGGTEAVEQQRKYISGALQALRELCHAKQLQSHALTQALQAFKATGYTDEADAVLLGAVEDAAANPLVGEAWMQRRLQTKGCSYPRRLPALLKRGEIGLRALAAYVDGLGDAKSNWRLRWVLRKHRQALQEHNRAWGAMLYALVNTGRHRAAVRWASGWSARPAVEMWMLRNIALALRSLAREAEAHAVVLHALQLPARDQSWASLKLWCAAEEAFAGRTEAAAGHLGPINPANLDPFDQRVHAFALGMVEVQQAPVPDRRGVWRMARQRVQELLGQSSPARSGLLYRRDYRRYLGRMARDAGSNWGAFLAWWRSFGG